MRGGPTRRSSLANTRNSMIGLRRPWAAAIAASSAAPGKLRSRPPKARPVSPSLSVRSADLGRLLDRRKLPADRCSVLRSITACSLWRIRTDRPALSDPIGGLCGSGQRFTWPHVAGWPAGPRGRVTSAGALSIGGRCLPRVPLVPAGVAAGERSGGQSVGQHRQSDGEVDGEHDQVLVRQVRLLDDDHREDDRRQPAGTEPAEEADRRAAGVRCPTSRWRPGSCAPA